MQADEIDIEREHLLAPAEATRHPALRNTQSGKAAHLAKIYRLFTRGVRGADGRVYRLAFNPDPDRPDDVAGSQPPWKPNCSSGA